MAHVELRDIALEVHAARGWEKLATVTFDVIAKNQPCFLERGINSHKRFLCSWSGSPRKSSPFSQSKSSAQKPSLAAPRKQVIKLRTTVIREARQLQSRL